MHKTAKILGSALLLGLAAGCTTASLEELRTATATGTPFQASLSREYLAYSESEARQYDWGTSKYFADKGLMAAYGQDVKPEAIEQWDIGEEFVPELSKARAELVKTLTPEKTGAQPELAARTQFFFDCWIEQQEEAWQLDDIASCREGFYRSLKTLAGVANAPKELMPAPDAKPLIFSSSYILFFEWNKYALTAEAVKIVDTVAEDLKESGEEKYEVILNGHADRSGSTEYNLKLSQNRAEAVKTALVERGIPEKSIRYYAFGESDNRITTPDDKREDANRRVEIFFNQ